MTRPMSSSRSARSGKRAKTAAAPLPVATLLQELRSLDELAKKTLDQFIRDIDQLRDQIARLEARLSSTEASAKKTDRSPPRGTGWALSEARAGEAIEGIKKYLRMTDDDVHAACVKYPVEGNVDGYTSFRVANDYADCKAVRMLWGVLSSRDVDMLNLSGRGWKRLFVLNVRNLAQLCSLTIVDLRSGARNFGITSVDEIREKLWLLRLKLPQDDAVLPWRQG